MATLLLTAVGTALGGPLGGALGALVGQQIDGAVFGRRKVEGPRLKELSVQTSSYGSALPLHFGTMRASGSVIWATELIEHREKSGGKGRPSVTSYSYTASFAVAISSRPIVGIGRIWADGNLLRGAAGDLKVGGTMRVHLGHGDQAADPLLAQAEGAANPAYRNLAYAVFEDLELADYGNRLPSLTFEVIADEQAVSATKIICFMLDDADAEGLGALSLAGFTVEQGGVGDVVSLLSELDPVSCCVKDERLAFRLADVASGALAQLPPPGAGGENAEDARANGWSRRREALPGTRQCAVRYYDIARDYQPGLQRSIGRSSPGDVETIELPAAMTAGEAVAVADRAARRRTVARDTLRYRISEIDQRFAPGAMVTTPVTDGVWRIEQWEWQADGVMLDLAAVPPATAPTSGSSVTDPGRSNAAVDLLAVPTQIVAFELPWDGSGDGTVARLRVAASASGEGWRGAALFTSSGDDQLATLGATGRRRAVIGTSVTSLTSASPLLYDAASSVDVELVGEDLLLGSVTWAQLMQGSNLALLGTELVQFSRAERLSGRTWRLSGLMRGRGGTEAAIASHLAGEAFALIDDRLIAIDAADVGDATQATIMALGLGDETPAICPILNPGLTLRPLSPVHGRARRIADGALTLDWVRRSRGSWTWPDEVELALNEPEELWEIAYGSAGSPARVWQTATAVLALTSGQVAELAALPGDALFSVRQIGRLSRSLPLIIPMPA